MTASSMHIEAAARVDSDRGIFQIIQVEYGIRHVVSADGGSSSDHFTLVGDCWDYQDEAALKRAVRRHLDPADLQAMPAREPDICGSIHDLILPVFPHLSLIQSMHLSDSVTGEPLYALENGWYWFNNAQDWDEQNQWFTPAQRAGHYLRCSPNLLTEITTKEQFAQLVDWLRPAWRKQAQATRAIYNLIDHQEN